MTAHDSVSVVIPAYNAERYLGEALESVMGQTMPPDQIVVVDDGSDDGTERVARSFPSVTYAPQRHIGPSTARNHGLDLSTGTHVAFLDADDVYAPDKLERQLAELRSSRQPDIVFGKVVQFRSPELGDEAGPPPSSDPVDGIHPGAMLLSRETFDRIGRFDDNEQFGDFIDWYARALEMDLRIHMLDHVVMRRRIHLDNVGRSHANRNHYARVLRGVLARRRSQT